MRTHPRISLPSLILLAFTSTAAAERLGQIRDVKHETSTVVIDGERYVVARDATLRHATDPDRLASLRTLREGMPVQYETEVDSTGKSRITRLIVLSDQ